MISFKEIQTALIKAGYSCGASGADGVWGRDSIGACRRFQIAKGLTVDGIPAGDTLTALFPGRKQPKPKDIPLAWFEEAKAHLGLHETPGRRTNAEIAKWLKRLNASWDDDETPWCGTFVGHCIAATLPEEPLPGNPFGARQWAKFGRRCPPQSGAVLVFWRTHRTKSGNGHVGFYAGEDATNYHVLGGNQSNAVTVAKVGKDRFLDARWPSTVLFLETASGMAAADVAGEGSEA
jgi:uncharacterized protein (TIGR02594 family)